MLQTINNCSSPCKRQLTRCREIRVSVLQVASLPAEEDVSFNYKSLYNSTGAWAPSSRGREFPYDNYKSLFHVVTLQVVSLPVMDNVSFHPSYVDEQLKVNRVIFCTLSSFHMHTFTGRNIYLYTVNINMY